MWGVFPLTCLQWIGQGPDTGTIKMNDKKIVIHQKKQKMNDKKNYKER